MLPVKWRNTEAKNVGEFGVNRDLFGCGFIKPLKLFSTCNSFDATSYHSNSFFTNLSHLMIKKQIKDLD